MRRRERDEIDRLIKRKSDRQREGDRSRGPHQASLNIKRHSSRSRSSVVEQHHRSLSSIKAVSGVVEQHQRVDRVKRSSAEGDERSGNDEMPIGFLCGCSCFILLLLFDKPHQQLKHQMDRARFNSSMPKKFEGKIG